MKRVLVLALAVVLLFALAGCRKAEKAKQQIVELVEDNYDTILMACKEKNTDALLTIDGIGEVAVVDGYVLVYCTGAGIAPSSQDYGFYYSEENQPVGVDCCLTIACDPEDMTPEGSGYQYYDSSYNGFYTEHIKGNLYFYSNSY